MATYDLWMTDAYGARLALLDQETYFNYSISVHSIGTIQVGIPYEVIKKKLGYGNVFLPDRQIEVWRNPGKGFSTNLERVYFIRKSNTYQRKEDGALMVSLYGRDAKDLLNRRYVIQAEETSPTLKTDYADDMMKSIVSEQMLYGSVLGKNGVQNNNRAFPEAYFSVQGNTSRGPTITRDFSNKKVLDACREIHDATVEKNIASSANRVIYFDVMETIGTNGRIGFEFQTFENYRGTDLTNGVRYSVDNGNIESPSLNLEYYDEVNAVFSKGQGRGGNRINELVENTNRIGASPWARTELVISSSAKTTARAQAIGYQALRENRPIRRLDAVFLSTPGDRTHPQSLYGVDWKVGDLLPVNFAEQYFEVEVKIVYVSVNDAGVETLTGRTNVGE